ncbi:MAG: hypothetical protein ABIO60_09845 [Aquaticitalea sp.]
MAPIKEEEQMKYKLENRRLQPSPENWANLANRLDAEQKKNNKTLVWSRSFGTGIAASLVGIVLVTALYFNSNSVENKTPALVDTKDNLIPENNNLKIDFPIIKEDVAIEAVNPRDNVSKVTESKLDKKSIFFEKSQSIDKLPQEEIVAQLLKTPSLSLVEVVKIKKSTLTLEEQKFQDVVDEINDLKAKGNIVADSEIEDLLKKAQNEILSNRIYNETTRTVDVNTLLQDVEADLQQSFRTKVFEALQSGYESVKTAVAQRNN